MMQGLTASHFATNFYRVQPEDVALVHAAAGGLGLLLTQIIKLRGGRVIGRVSNQDKVAIAKDAGADHVIVDSEGQFASEVIRLSGGERCPRRLRRFGARDLPGLARFPAPMRYFLLVRAGSGRSGTPRHHEPAEEYQNWLRRLRRSCVHADAAAIAFRTIV